MIPHGVDIEEFKLTENGASRGIGRRPFTFGFLGRLSEEKRPDYVVEMARRFPQFRFIIAGDGLMRSQIENAVAKNGLADRVQLLGFVATPQDFYNVVDAVLIPSRVEGLPIVMLEAMALGKTVIASRVGMIGQVIEDGKNGFTVTAGDIDELARTVYRVSEMTADERISLGCHARETIVHTYSLEHCAMRYLDVFRRTADVKPTAHQLALMSQQLKPAA